MVFLLLAACTESTIDLPSVNNETEQPVSAVSYWGHKIDDPYSVTNMRRAYDVLLSDKESSLSKSGVSKDIIMPTHLYLKFIPKNHEEWKTLVLDSVLDVVPFPLDYDLEGVDGVYRDPECPADQPTYQYSVVKLGYPLPDIEYVVIDSLYMLFDDAISKSGHNMSFWKELELESVKLTGNYNEDDVVPLSLSKRYHPDGKVTYEDSKRGKIGVPNARVVVHYATHKHSCQTKSDGSFRIDETFSFKVKYKVFFQNNDLLVCGSSMNSVISSEGDKGVVCNDFKINSDYKKSAAATHVAGYDFFHNTKGVGTEHKKCWSTYFTDYSNDVTNTICFHSQFESAAVNKPDYTSLVKRYSDAMFMLSGLVLENEKNILIPQYDDFSREWSKGVRWYLTKDVYNISGEYWECLVKDLMDNDNSTCDKVGGYSIGVLYNCIVKSNSMDELRNELKKLTTSTAEKNNLDVLFNYWKTKLNYK